MLAAYAVAVSVSTAVFVGLHAAMTRLVNRPWAVVLKLSRGIASLVLVTIGFSALAFYLPLWRRLFIVDHGLDAAFFVIGLVTGHLLADLLWLYVGVRRGERARRDLVWHHLFGLVVCAVVLGFRMGYATVAVGLTTEMLPVTSGVIGLGQALGRPRIELWGNVLGLAVLWLWRLPAWAFVVAVVGWSTVTGQVPEDLVRLYPIAVAAVAIVVFMDVRWSGEYLRKIRPQPA